MTSTKVAYVSGAGVMEVNGEYIYKGEINGAAWFGRTTFYEGRIVTFSICHCTMRDRTNKWFICISPDSRSPGTPEDIDFYRTDAVMAVVGSGELMPPPHWTFICAKGASPAPTLMITENSKKMDVGEEQDEGDIKADLTDDPSVDDIQQRLAGGVDCVLRAAKTIEQRIRTLERKEAQLRQMEQAMRDHAATAKDRIKLDIGGRIFATSKANLLKFEGSYFHALVSSGHWLPNEEGAYFIDISPKHFDHVLEYLRTGRLALEHVDDRAVAEIKGLFQYFLLRYPGFDFCWDGSKCGQQLLVSNNRLTVRKDIGGPGWNAGVLGKESVGSFSVCLDALGEAGRAMIGFAPREGFDVNGANFFHHGWFLFAHNGSLYSQSGHKNVPFTSKLDEGCVISLKLEEGRIRFERDGAALGTAFDDVPTCVRLYPAVYIFDMQFQCSMCFPE